ncbi:MAG: hypothetical protein N3G74_00195 [Candidatus Micrarchaeota archaeon]|nr:hypothetical protein [Candidatus Micrarchaeota archaeon]
MESFHNKGRQEGKKKVNVNKRMGDPKSEQIYSSFKKTVEQEMKKCIEEHKHCHPEYAETCIIASKIDEKNGIAAWVLFEQIDTDRNAKRYESSGWLGDQYRYSLWVMKNGSKPKQIYSENARIRSEINNMTGTRGRDCSIDFIKLTERVFYYQFIIYDTRIIYADIFI